MSRPKSLFDSELAWPDPISIDASAHVLAESRASKGRKAKCRRLDVCSSKELTSTAIGN